MYRRSSCMTNHVIRPQVPDAVAMPTERGLLLLCYVPKSADLDITQTWFTDWKQAPVAVDNRFISESTNAQ